MMDAHTTYTILSLLQTPTNGYGFIKKFFNLYATGYFIKSFKKCLVQEVGKLNKKLVHITEQELLEQMGFPPNWKNIARYRLTPKKQKEEDAALKKANIFLFFYLCCSSSSSNP